MPVNLIHRCQQGFTTITLMGTLLVGGLLVAATFTAVQPDIAFTKKDEDGKQAYGAAEAGLNYYLNRLGQDNSYYVHCTNVLSPSLNAVNLQWVSGTTDPRTWQTIQGSQAQYTVELLAVQNSAVSGTEQCVENDGGSMVDPKTGTFRIRATGRVRAPSTGTECSTANPPSPCRPAKRSIIATLRRKSFIDFLWFTDFETADPYAYDLSNQPWALANCANKYRPQRNTGCSDQNFITGDALNGPFKTNDSISVCGDPSFGRNSDDDIELNQDSPGWSADCSGSDPNFKGTIRYPAGVLPMPQSNAELEAAADQGYVFDGETRLVFNGTTVTITNNGTTTTKALPPSGVIYVNNTTGCNPYDLRQDYPNTVPNPPTTNGYMEQPGCGNVWVQGTYNSDITIGADNDIIVTDDLKASPAFNTTTNSSTVLAGLIANNFVRVYHPGTFGSGSSCTNNGGPGSIQIDAAILALNHSFLVDNYYCGDPLGTLTVNGAIAQKYRGTVGQHSGGTPTHGYLKNYVYNTSLRYREPPYFINPTESAWRVVRQNEQVPAR
jgi:Tfp pilus assembly protein PilX